MTKVGILLKPLKPSWARRKPGPLCYCPRPTLISYHVQGKSNNKKTLFLLCFAFGLHYLCIVIYLVLVEYPEKRQLE